MLALHGADGLEQRQVEGQQHAGHDDRHQDQHDRLHQREGLGHAVVQLLVVEVGDRGQHVAEGARLLAHLHHLQGEVVQHAGGLEGGGEALALADVMGGGGDRLRHGAVADRGRGHVQGVHQRQAAGQQRGQGARELAGRVHPHEPAQVGHAQQHAVENHRRALAAQPGDERDPRPRDHEHEPEEVVADEVGDGHQARG